MDPSPFQGMSNLILLINSKKNRMGFKKKDFCFHFFKKSANGIILFIKAPCLKLMSWIIEIFLFESHKHKILIYFEDDV